MNNYALFCNQTIIKIFCLLAMSLQMIGCVDRQIHIQSDPPGAVVFLDGKKIGVTPVSTSFNFYGTRELTLIKEKYHILSRSEVIIAPFYQIFPLDFFVEVLLPIPLKDYHYFSYTLRPYVSSSSQKKDSLLKRAEKLRSEAPKKNN